MNWFVFFVGWLAGLVTLYLFPALRPWIQNTFIPWAREVPGRIRAKLKRKDAKRRTT